MIHLKLFLITIIGLWSFNGFANSQVVNCYYNTLSNYRPGDGKFELSDIDPSLCTHLCYGPFGINGFGEFQIVDTLMDLGSELAKIKYLRKRNPGLKALVAIGGWNHGSVQYSNMASNINTRQLFITSTTKFIRDNGFDGLDLNCDYPAQLGGRTQENINFETLLKEIKEAFEPDDLLLTITPRAPEDSALFSYDISGIFPCIDYINIMPNDFAVSYDGVLGFNAPLKGQGKNNVQSSIEYWLQKGASASKLILGLGLYGRSFQLYNSEQTTPGSPSLGPGSPGPYTEKMGYMGYNEICILDNSWTYKWAASDSFPYMYKGNQWIGYDNVQSIKIKMDLVKFYKLAGAMVLSIDTDDFHGKCGEKYPLLNAINNKP